MRRGDPDRPPPRRDVHRAGARPRRRAALGGPAHRRWGLPQPRGRRRSVPPRAGGLSAAEGGDVLRRCAPGALHLVSLRKKPARQLQTAGVRLSEGIRMDHFQPSSVSSFGFGRPLQTWVHFQRTFLPIFLNHKLGLKHYSL